MGRPGLKFRPDPDKDIVVGPVVFVGAGSILRDEIQVNQQGRAHSIKRGIRIAGHNPVLVTVKTASRREVSLLFSRASWNGSNWYRLSEGDISVMMEPCPEREVTAWAGGFVATRPTCAHLIVRSDSDSEQVVIPMGRSCAQ